MPFLPLYVQELGVTDPAEAAFWSGLALSVSPLLAALLAPVWGAAADRFGRKPMFARSLLSFSILMVCLSLITNVYQMVAIRAIWGLLGGFASLATALVTLSCPRDQMSRAIGSVQSAQTISYAIGPAMGGLLADQLGLRRSFYVPAVLYIAALLLTQLVYKEERAAPHAREAKTGSSLRDVLRLPYILPIVAVLFIAQFVDKSFGAVLPLFVDTLEADGSRVATMSGLIVSVGAIAAALSASIAGRLAGKHQPRQLVVFSLLGGLIVCLPIVFVNATWQLLFLRTLLGLLAGGTITLAYTMGGLAMPPGGRATMFGFLSSAALFGTALSPMTSGLLAGISLRSIFAIDVVLYGVALIAMATAKPPRISLPSAQASVEIG